jgi:hypothetical protein
LTSPEENKVIISSETTAREKYQLVKQHKPFKKRVRLKTGKKKTIFDTKTENTLQLERETKRYKSIENNN